MYVHQVNHVLLFNKLKITPLILQSLHIMAMCYKSALVTHEANGSVHLSENVMRGKNYVNLPCSCSSLSLSLGGIKASITNLCTHVHTKWLPNHSLDGGCTLKKGSDSYLWSILIYGYTRHPTWWIAHGFVILLLHCTPLGNILIPLSWYRCSLGNSP